MKNLDGEERENIESTCQLHCEQNTARSRRRTKEGKSRWRSRPLCGSGKKTIQAGIEGHKKGALRIITGASFC